MDWPILNVLSDVERQALLRIARRRRFTRNEVIFHEGDPGDTIHRAWLVARGHRRVRYRGVERNQLGLSLRIAAINLRRLVNLGLTRTPSGWALH